ncbi:ureidoglycolate dehydrogenase [Desemzia sp. RIT804]|uniref:ureidoglycolate dehydrogenase n=1 Tax=Desemzia sp. RIT 804 TaxID=2810209 RepID=UPI00194F6048|nr:ureidoglycolate dehydrogenase [Desemzia sp. RIT 804]MBM6615226.1 ureidoglycolate dehydrogenase [Desemzia sp. RIT 804]
MRITEEELFQLMETKFLKAGLNKRDAHYMSDVLTFADARGIHSHGAVRVEYYVERIVKKGITREPHFEFTKNSSSVGIFEADNGSGQAAAALAMEKAVEMAKETGVSVVGIRHMSHSGALGYFTELAARNQMIGISMCQSDPMVVPYGGAEAYYGTNPIAFSAPANNGEVITFDMATSVQAWGKILDKRSRAESIPDNWGVDKEGKPTTDPYKVNALLPIAGPKGYGLMMMVDILSGILLGLPFGKHVSSMYEDLSKGRDLGQLHIVIDPSFFTNIQRFTETVSQSMEELQGVKPAESFEKVYYPGEIMKLKREEYLENGIELVDNIYDYLISDKLHHNQYDHKNKFAE